MQLLQWDLVANFVIFFDLDKNSTPSSLKMWLWNTVFKTWCLEFKNMVFLSWYISLSLSLGRTPLLFTAGCLKYVTLWILVWIQLNYLLMEFGVLMGIVVKCLSHIQIVLVLSLSRRQPSGSMEVKKLLISFGIEWNDAYLQMLIV